MIAVLQKQCTIYLMRHGMAAAPDLFTGQSDLPLEPEGEAQMRAWSDFFAPIPIAAIWSSPLARAKASAKIIMQGLNRQIPDENLFIAEDLKEISLGKWEGLNRSEVRRKYPDLWKARGRDFMRVAPPGGESFEALSRRVVPAFEALFPTFMEHRHVLVMAHQAVNRAILARLGEPFAESWLDIAQDYAALNELELTKKRSGAWNCNIIRVNAHPPLWLR